VRVVILVTIAATGCGRVGFAPTSSSDATIGTPGDACVDTGSDPHNCGACGHDCEGGACSDGVCQPFALATFDADANYLAVDAANVYWTNDDGTVMQCPLDGCGSSPIVLASEQPGPNGITVNATTVFWANYNFQNPSAVVACAIGGCGDAPTVVADNQTPYDVAVDATNVYWTNFNDNSVYVCAIDGCADTPTLITNAMDAWSIAVDGAAVYWSENTGAGRIERCALGGSCNGAAQIAIDQVNPGGLVLDAANVYWSNFANGLVQSCAKAGSGCGDSPNVIAGAETNPLSVAVDSDTVYWPTGSGSIRACAIAGCTEPTTLVANQISLNDIAVDATAVYWTGSGAIMKLVK
jgi:hypothetical protein